MRRSECPFCASDNIHKDSGKMKCLDCLAEYEIDDVSECIFANTDDLRLPLRGTVCPHCGLLQCVDTNKFRLCGTPISCDSQR